LSRRTRFVSALISPQFILLQNEFDSLLQSNLIPASAFQPHLISLNRKTRLTRLA